ncbi:MAG: FMN-binding protein [Promethearchaeota archaeon]
MKLSLKNSVAWLAILSLLAAYIIGQAKKGTQIITQLHNSLPQSVEFYKISNKPLLFESRRKGTEEFYRYISVEKAQGWGGPLLLAAVIDSKGIIERIIVLDHKETPPFFYKIQKHKFFRQFTGKKVSAPLLLGQDIDAVTQATISSKAITEAVRKGTHALGRKILKFPIKEHQKVWKFGIKEVILLLLYILALIDIKLISKILRYFIISAAFIFLGFYLNAAISIGNISALFFGYIPPLKENIFWWLLIFGALSIPLILRRNLYCYYLCPFGALQEFTNKISGINLRLNKKNFRLIKHTAYVLTWLALIIIFLTSNPALGAYEPFATFFRAEGMSIQWYILPAVVFGSFFILRLFCRFFCPVGVILKILIKFRSKFVSISKTVKRESFQKK